MEPLKIKRQESCAYQTITVRLPEKTLKALNQAAFSANCSRNELVTRFLAWALENMIIE